MTPFVRRLPIALALIAASQPGAAAEAISQASLERAALLRDQALQSSEAFALVESLTTEVGPRLAGSSGDEAAVAWALVKLQELGFENVRAENVEVPHWERGEISVEITAPFPQPLVATALGGSVGTAESGIEAPVLAVRDLAELEALPRSRVEGHIVFFNDRMERTRDASSYNRVVKNRVHGAAAAGKLGAVAVIIRSAGTSSDRIAHTGTTRYAEDGPRIPAAAISNPDADLLERQLASADGVTLRLRSSARRLGTRRSANVIGELPGDKTPEEIIILAAHLDSWDLGQGAVDDATGVAIAIEAVRQIRAAGLTPRRTLRIVLYANEEFGLSGGKTYAARYQDALDRHILGLEADLGPGRVWRLDSRVGEAALPLVAAMHKVLEPLGIARGNNEAYGGADLVPLRDAGMPVLGPRPDATRYFDVHHTVNDTLDKVDRDGLDQNVATFAVLAYLAAQTNADFGRLPVVVTENGKKAEKP